jgi:hypothetical protein
VAIIALLGYFGAPLVAEASAALAPGIGLKTATLWGFGTTVVLFLVFAMVAGDGILGELPFMLGAFFTFFAILTLLIAWIF